MSSDPPPRWIVLPPLAIALSAAALAGARAQGLLANTAEIAAGTAALALPLGAGLALLTFKSRLYGARLATVVLLTMLFVPLHLHTAAWRAGFGTLGWFTQSRAGSAPVDPLLTGAAGVIWVHATAAVAWVALLVGVTLRGVDRRLEEQALLAQSAARVLWSVSMRAAAPALLVAAGWVMVTLAHEMTASDLFQVRTFAEEVYTLHALGLFDPTNADEPAHRMLRWQLALGLIAIAATGVAIFWAAGRVLVASSNGPRQTPWRWTPRHKLAWSGVLLVPVLMLSALPVGNLLTKSGGRAVREADTWRREWSPAKAVGQLAAAPVHYRRELAQSAKLGVLVATGALLVGGAVAWRMRRAGAERLAWLAGIAICLTIPGPMIGLAAIRVFNQPTDSPLAMLSWLYDHTLFVPWLVQMVRAVPIAALVLWPVWQAVPQGLLDAARVAGACGWWVAVRLRWPAVAAAWLAALAVSAAELGATLLVMPPGDTTLTLQLFNLLHSGVDDRVAAISLWMIAFFAVVAWGITLLWERADPAVTR